MADYEGTTVNAYVNSGNMVFEPILRSGVFRFDCSTFSRNEASPSLSFADTKDRDTPLVSNHNVPTYTPSYAIKLAQQLVNIELPHGTSFYGTGEVAGQLERTGKRVFTWNRDAYGYSSGTTSLYQSHPWVLAVFQNGEALGILADITKRCEIDLRKESTIKFIAPPSYPIITFGPFASALDVLESLSQAIGTVPLPPKWSLGYQQARYGYDSDARVREIAKIFRDKCIPCDGIWIDIDYMDGFRCFTFDQTCSRAVWMLNPGIKQEKGYFVYESGSENDIWIQTAEGQPSVAVAWPGPCVFPDFTQSKARSWWANLVKDFISNGVDGIWNDMNEPAVKTITKTLPESNIHKGDIELGGCQNHSHYHNVYGMLMARSTHEGMELADNSKRPFVLARAGFLGGQRYGATWTGDNQSTWEHLHMSIPMVLQLGLSGQPFSGADIGGFAGNATPKLFGRWMGVGAMFPFCRGHSDCDTIDHEPWSFGKECEDVCRLALKRRYRLIPHIYTLFYLAHTKGSPVVAPTFFADSKDPSLRASENSFMLGPLLIYASTVLDCGVDRLHHKLPKGTWLSFDFEDSNPDLPAMYLQGGSIIPFGPPYQHVGEAKPTDDLSLLVALDENGKAEGILYEDEGDGYEYLKGGFLLTTYAAELLSTVVNVRVSKVEGSWKRPNRRVHVHLLLGKGAMIDAWGTDGEDLQIIMPLNDEVVKLVIASEKNYNIRIENAICIPDIENISGCTRIELSKPPVVMKVGDWALKVVPWIGGRIISMEHLPSGIQWLYSRFEVGGYEEYSGVEHRSAGCSEKYTVIGEDLEKAGEVESMKLEGYIGGGLVIERKIYSSEGNLNVLTIESSILVRDVGAGPGGFSRPICLRVHPRFNLLHPSESYISFVSVNGSKHEIRPEFGEQSYEGDLRPNGEWMIVDKCLGLCLINRFDINQVFKCHIDGRKGTISLELWSAERLESNFTPLKILHHYEVKQI